MALGFRQLLALGLLAFLTLAAWADIRIADDFASEVTLPQPAQRIISLAPNITELLFAVGAGDQIVGADEFSNYPEAAKNIPRVNNYAAANYELILSLKPDLVLVWQSGNGNQIADRLRQLGLPVFVVEPRRLKDIPGLFARLGQLTGHRSEAERQIDSFNRAIGELRRRYGAASPVTVFYQIWNEPLITLNGKHLVSDVINLCGGHNVFADAPALVPYVSVESVVRANPQVIVASGSSPERPKWLDMWQVWPSISAVKNNRVHHIPPDLLQRHSLRIVEGAKQLCGYLQQAREG